MGVGRADSLSEKLGSTLIVILIVYFGRVTLVFVLDLDQSSVFKRSCILALFAIGAQDMGHAIQLVEGLELVVTVYMFGQSHQVEVDLLVSALVRPFREEHSLLWLRGFQNNLLALLIIIREV